MTWAHPGTYSLQQNDVVPYECSHSERVLGEIDELASQCGRLESLTNPDLRWLRTLVDCNLTSLDVPFEPTFVHHSGSVRRLHRVQRRDESRPDRLERI